MTKQSFQALVAEEQNNEFITSVKERQMTDLPEGELLVKVCCSSLNYKDALSASGNKGVTSSYPHTPGIDAAGTVVSDDSDQFKAGDKVIVTSYDLGMNTDGGFAEYIRVPAAWAVPLPDGLSLEESMMLGTAGLTAAQSIHAISEKISPADGEILVTGATGGVGSLAVAMLSKLGYSVCALTGKASAGDYLKSLVAESIIDRNTFVEENKRPLSKPRWAGVVDAVGGDILASAIKSTKPLGIVTCFGMVGSPELSLTVFPFILRGVSLVGIDSQSCPMDLRQNLWTKMASAWKPDNLSSLIERISLQQVPGAIEKMLSGQHQGRMLVDIASD